MPPVSRFEPRRGDLPFDKPGRFYRGNLHMHSTRSDGVLGIEEAIATYRDHGYDFVSLTDHFMARYEWPLIDTRSFRTDTFTTLIGAELHTSRIVTGEPWHILAVGLPLDFPAHSTELTGAELAARAREAGAFVAIAHPNWYALSYDEASTIEAAHAVEVYNHGCVVEVDRGESWHIADMLAVAGRRLTAVATDDSHFKAEDYRGGWVQVRAESLDPDRLLESLKAGHFYSSTGPELRDVRIEDGRIRIECSPARAIVVTGRGARGVRLNVPGGVESADLPLEKFDGTGYCRVTVVDAAGRRAWTNPIWLE
jgi:predicted metal-dependent phosphoesterase TrpH